MNGQRGRQRGAKTNGLSRCQGCVILEASPMLGTYEFLMS